MLRKKGVWFSSAIMAIFAKITQSIKTITSKGGGEWIWIKISNKTVLWERQIERIWKDDILSLKKTQYLRFVFM